MKAHMAIGLTLALLTGGALAQTAATPPAPAVGIKAPPPPPPAGPDGAADDMGGPPPPPPGGPGPRGHRPPPPPPSRAAHFRLERGDTVLDVKCADDEPMKACADLALQMLDRLQAPPPKP